MVPHILNLRNRRESGQLHAPERHPLELTEQEALKHECTHFFTAKDRFRYCAFVLWGGGG